MREALFIASNLGITMAYVFVAAFVIPRTTLRLKRTRYGGVGFFLLCGLHHLENVSHVIFEGDLPAKDVLTSTHMLLIDVPQVFCVAAFVIGLYAEAVRWGPWHAGVEGDGP